MIDLSSYTSNVDLDRTLIYRVSQSEPISFPEEAHDWLNKIEQISFWFKHRNQIILELVKRYPPSGVIFDIGGGNGYVSIYLNESQYNSVLVEPNLKGCINAKNNGLTTIICSSLQEVDFFPESLPAVGLFDVLEHISDEQDLLRYLFILMAPGSRLYLTVPAYQWLWSKDDEYAGHFRRYNSRGLEESLRKAGFMVEFVSHFFFATIIPIYLLRTLPDKLFNKRNVDVSNFQNYHSISSKMLSSLIKLIHDKETLLLKRGIPIPFGSSLALVAQKSMK